MSFRTFFKGKKILITGHTGFKGSWLSIWLIKLGAKVYGISLKPQNNSMFVKTGLQTQLSNYFFDITDTAKLAKTIKKIQPNIIFHLAAQSLLPHSIKDPINTWKTNIIGTASILNSLKNVNNKNKVTCVIITSDKCYENKEWLWGYKETDILGGKDPYSSSKAAAEIVYSSFHRTYGKKNSKLLTATARAGNVIGGGDYSLNRILPDCIKSWKKNKIVYLRNPHSTRPWQFVLEPLRGYMQLAYRLNISKKINGESFNFGPDENQEKSVINLVKEFSKNWKQARWRVKRNNSYNESGLLKLNCEKAKKLLNWTPKLDFKKTVYFTSTWYQGVSSNKKLNYLMSIKQIEEYENSVK